MSKKSFKDLDNPFVVQTPEEMMAQDAAHLFVDVFTDFPKIKSHGHAFLHGPRGSGKSMMFRFLQPDCQLFVKNCDLCELDFFSIWVKTKKTAFNRPELERLENKHACNMLNEHYMISIICEILFSSLMEIVNENTKHIDESNEKLRTLFDFVVSSLELYGWSTEKVKRYAYNDNLNDSLRVLHTISSDVLNDFKNYYNKLAFNPSMLSYNGPILTYLDYLCPLLECLKNLPFMPNGPTYLLFDDADLLNDIQTKILNSWVSTRTSGIISLKISTQLKYKTYFTIQGQRIESPHDYSEVNISTKYTTSKNHYLDRVKNIVRKRLECYSIEETDPEVFFPFDVKQEQEIEIIKKKYMEEWKSTGRGNTPYDDATRYARPDFMKSLFGTRKSGPTYSYAGFSQLVHISSGIIRHFLDAATQMYADTKSLNSNEDVKCIPVSIQDKIVKLKSEELLHTDFEKLLDDEDTESPNEHELLRLRNLIESLGGMFHQVLVSERSERRVFSIALTNKPDRELRKILKLGVETGYLQNSTIGNKAGTGRTDLYILTRRLAPYFKLDPTSFAGYLFITNHLLWEGINNPQKMLRSFSQRLKSDDISAGQLHLFY